jgi:Ankyrin repeats (3 copies)
VTIGPSATTAGLLPSLVRVCGWSLLAGQSILTIRIVYESTILTCGEGPQMIGFALAHTGPSIFLIGLLLLPLGLVFAAAMLVFGFFKRLRFSRSEWLLLCGFLLGILLLAVPYSAWERLDVTVCSAGPLGDALLLDEARVGDLDQVTKLVAQGHSVNHEARDGETPLSAAAQGKRLEVAEFLLGRGADVNHKSSVGGDTPLMEAAKTGNVEMAKLLLEHGADPCTVPKYQYNNNAQRIAETNHNSATAEYLAAHFRCVVPPPLPTTCPSGSAASCVEVH